MINPLEYRPSMLPMESAAIVRGLLRVGNSTDAIEVLHDELSLPLEVCSKRNQHGRRSHHSDSSQLVSIHIQKGAALDNQENQEQLKYRALSLASIVSRHFFAEDPVSAVSACQLLAELGPLVRQARLTSLDLNIPWLRIIQGAGKCETARRAGAIPSAKQEEDNEVKLPCNVVYSVLTAMSTFPYENDDLVFEAISNALVRRVLFVTGAVEMSGCPPADRGEAVFIGRSNVGKSSLVNMVREK